MTTSSFHFVKRVFLNNKVRYRLSILPRKFSKLERDIISKELSFYNRLTKWQQVEFEDRVLRFIEAHEFVSRENVVLTNRMKLLISGTAVMITFGFHSYLLSMFTTIIVFPEHYFSTINKQYHKGEANPMVKAVVFSWQDFEEGIKITNDNLNLGIHELTHALYFSFIKEQSSSARHFRTCYKDLLDFLKDPKEQQKVIKAKYLRDYAFENQHEFLAVMVEHFFETPDVFKEKLPQIYYRLRKVFNIDFAGY